MFVLNVFAKRLVYGGNIYRYSNFLGLSKEEAINKFRQMAPPHRDNPIIMKLDSAEFKSIFTEELKTLSLMFTEYNYDIRIAGGAVRDLLMGMRPKDLDFATTATPDQMKQMFTEKDVRMINMNGEKHGTITPRINDRENFEVTTLRIDVATDGRHAEVLFTTDWLLDANRRDLTINSMFLGFDGSVYDYFYGYDDVQKRRIAFVGNPTTRIQEDFLRILRYFRFYGRIAESSENHECETLNAIKDNVTGLDSISGERIWTELKKILDGNYAGELLSKIIDCNINSHIGLPLKCNLEELKTVWANLKDTDCNAVTLLSSVLHTEMDGLKLHARLKFSAFERDLILFILMNREYIIESDQLQYYKDLTMRGKHKDIRKFVSELMKYKKCLHIKEFEEWVAPKFPVSGTMLQEKGVERGKFLGLVINELKEDWIESRYTFSVEELLHKVPNIVSHLREKKKNKND